MGGVHGEKAQMNRIAGILLAAVCIGFAACGGGGGQGTAGLAVSQTAFFWQFGGHRNEPPARFRERDEFGRRARIYRHE